MIFKKRKIMWLLNSGLIKEIRKITGIYDETMGLVDWYKVELTNGKYFEKRKLKFALTTAYNSINRKSCFKNRT